MLALTLLVPAVYKFAHIFAHHKHDICKGEKSTHLHEINPDCDFYKFKLSTSYTITFSNFVFICPQENSLKMVSQYQFLSKFQRLQTALRGPPSLV
ncbi:hypothetical protein EV196_102595 [Mariniflexile fucanivorans]|uniref:Uncharacterized protein n=2 Tax=Mariniflexile fucanivorans TaxID=264023 RepID=A0A4R1RNX5_9FLAO|nr:hypothetical protein EV196_102595 [Mariniflexile fucanivorans]